MKIALRHGAGGEETSKLIHGIFATYFQNDILNKMEDAAVLPKLNGVPVFTSDSFVVEPLFFPGGDIGKLSVCGTVNDLACMGAKPLYLTASFILETGLDSETLEKIVASMAATAEEAGVKIVAGDTKVVEGNGGLYINTAGIGARPSVCNISAANLKPKDAVIITGTLGDHHATILTQRLQMETSLQSDCAPPGYRCHRTGGSIRLPHQSGRGKAAGQRSGERAQRHFGAGSADHGERRKNVAGSSS